MGVADQLGCPCVEVSRVLLGSVELPLHEEPSENSFTIEITQDFDNLREFGWNLTQTGEPGFYRCCGKTTVNKLKQKSNKSGRRKPKNNGTGFISKNGLILIER